MPVCNIDNLLIGLLLDCSSNVFSLVSGNEFYPSSVHPTIYPSIQPSILLSIHLSFYPSIYPSIHPATLLSCIQQYSSQYRCNLNPTTYTSSTCLPASPCCTHMHFLRQNSTHTKPDQSPTRHPPPCRKQINDLILLTVYVQRGP